MIAVSGLAKSFGPQTLFRDVAFQLNPGQRYGLVGANGSGKSTLLKVLTGEELPSEGTVSIPKRLRLGVLGQDHFQYDSTPILDVVLMGHAELWAAMVTKNEILAKAGESFDADRYAEVEDIVLRHDGYAAEAQAAEILEGLGIETELHRQPMSVLSGGFKLRVLLGQALASRPDALLLDEPTNHLDILSIRWLEKFLQDYAGLVVVISHDHRFLDNVCTHILDVDYETVTLYTGDYTAFTEAKVSDRDRKEKELDKREKEIAHHKAFVERFRAKATKARQAQSKLRLIEKKASEIDYLAPSSRRYPTFRFVQKRPSGKQVLALEGVSKAYGSNQVLTDVSLTVRRGDRLAIIGPNGIGKSTLLKIALGKLKCDRGKIEWGHETHPGYFAQDHRELLEGSNQTVEAWLWDSCPGETVGFVRGRLARVLFSKDEALKKVSALSGGEAARLIFARLAVEEPNVLVLDEPTNHLDLEAIEAMVEGLQDYDGTLLLVSHDRWFVSRLATRIIEIGRTGLNDYQGTYDEYVEGCGDDHLDAEVVLKKARKEKRARKARQSDPKTAVKRDGALRKDRDRLTERIEAAEARVHEINEIFCDPSYFDRTPAPQVRKLELEQKGLKAEIEELMEAWEAIEEPRFAEEQFQARKAASSTIGLSQQSTEINPMNMSGLLKTFPPAELLQWAHNDRLTGTLVVRRSSREKRVQLREGKIVGCLSNERFEFYGQFLLAAGLVSEHQLLVALSHCEESAGKPRLGEAIVELGFLDEEQVVQSLVTQTEQSILDLFLWPRGVFFILDDEPPEPKLPIPPIDPIRLVFEGVRQIDEVARIRARLPHDGVVLQPGPTWPGEGLSHLGARIVGLHSPGKTLSEMHDATGGGYCAFLGETDGLLQAGDLEVGSLGEPAPDTQTLSLLDLMLDRIHEERQATIGVTVGMPLAVFGQLYALWLDSDDGSRPEAANPTKDFTRKLDGRHRLSSFLSIERQVRDEQLEWLWLQIGNRRLVLLPQPASQTLRKTFADL